MNGPSLDQAFDKGDWLALRHADESVVRIYLSHFLDAAAEDPVAIDSDRVIGRGVDLGRAGRRDVDAMALRWLRRRPADELPFQLVFAFLGGFWQTCPSPIPARRVESLMSAADGFLGANDGFRYGLLVALTSALETGIDDPGPARTRVETLARRTWPEGMDRFVAGLLDQALG